jgi:hypothetical protein
MCSCEKGRKRRWRKLCNVFILSFWDLLRHSLLAVFIWSFWDLLRHSLLAVFIWSFWDLLRHYLLAVFIWSFWDLLRHSLLAVFVWSFWDLLRHSFRKLAELFYQNFTFEILGAFTKLRKVNISFLISLSVCLSIHMEHLGSHLTDFHEIWHVSIFLKSFEKKSGFIKIWPEYQVLYMKTYVLTW